MKKLLFYLALFLFLGIFLFSGYRIYDKMIVYKQIEEVYDDLAELVVQTFPPMMEAEPVESGEGGTHSALEGCEAPTEETEAVAEEPSPYADVVAPIQVDFETLCAINPDVVGWLYCEGTVINYPVLKGETNDTYLYHRYDGAYSSGGSIFMDYRCESDLSDGYTIIYGHNMLADSMFNCLDYFRKQDYLEEHSRFFYLTPSGENYCFEVICSNLTAYKDELRLFEVRDEERNLELIRKDADADTGIEANNEDHLVLLATCTYDFHNAKYTLLCKAMKLG